MQGVASDCCELNQDAVGHRPCMHASLSGTVSDGVLRIGIGIVIVIFVSFVQNVFKMYSKFIQNVSSLAGMEPHQPAQLLHVRCGNFDIVLEPVSRISQHPTRCMRSTPCSVPVLIAG